jgi:hypothetical protein
MVASCLPAKYLWWLYWSSIAAIDPDFVDVKYLSMEYADEASINKALFQGLE